MPLIRYQSPDDPAFVVFDQSRFRVDHGVFLLHPCSIRARIGEILEEHRGWDLRILKLVAENQRLAACAEWLDAIEANDDRVILPELHYEPAIDLVADRLIGDGDFASVECPVCQASFTPEGVRRESWEFEEEGTAVLGRNTLCGRGHIVHAFRESVFVSGIELEGD